MKNLVLAALLSLSASAYAGLDCNQMATKAASDLYLNCETALTVTSSSVAINPKNSSNGLSLIVSLNESKYLVLLSVASPDGSTRLGCSSVQYVIAYPYANLMPQ